MNKRKIEKNEKKYSRSENHGELQDKVKLGQLKE